MDLAQVMDTFRQELSSHYQSVRITTVQTPEQMLREIKAINPDRLPGVILVLDLVQHLSPAGITEIQVSAVLVDRFTADSDARAIGVMRAADTLLTLYPPGGRHFGEDAWVHTTDAVAATPDPQYAAIAVGLTVKTEFAQKR